MNLKIFKDLLILRLSYNYFQGDTEIMTLSLPSKSIIFNILFLNHFFPLQIFIFSKIIVKTECDLLEVSFIFVEAFTLHCALFQVKHKYH